MDRSPRHRTRFLLSSIVLLVCCGGCAVSGKPDGESQELPLMIFAAASLQDLVADLADELQADEPVPVTISFAGTNTLAQQIMAAPGADLFLSADARWMDHLDAAGRLVTGSRRQIMGNRLVLVARRDARFPVDGLPIDNLRALADTPFRHLAIGDPEAVPAGHYARAALEHLKIWDQLVDRVLPSPNVRAALALVESDPEILGIVYHTDAVISDRIKVLAGLEPVPGLDITYQGAVVRDGSNPVAAERFLTLIASPRGQALLTEHGFLPVD